MLYVYSTHAMCAMYFIIRYYKFNLNKNVLYLKTIISFTIYINYIAILNTKPYTYSNVLHYTNSCIMMILYNIV